MDTGGSTVSVKTTAADVVHGLLERVAFPAEEVVSVSGGATIFSSVFSPPSPRKRGRGKGKGNGKVTYPMFME